MKFSISLLITSTECPQRISILTCRHLREKLPLTYDLATSQNIQFNVIGNSWWTSSYIHASDGKVYFIVSHIGSPQSGFWRYSILDIENPEYYKQCSLAGSELDPITNYIHGANITLPSYGFEAVEPDNTLKGMRTWSTSGIEFDLTFDFSSPVIINGVTGTYKWGLFFTYQWSLVGGVTKGTFKVEDEELSIDPERSLTWYDRQIVLPSATTPLEPGLAGSQNWTWFQLHYHTDDHKHEGTPSASKVSAWIWDYADEPRVQFASTIQDQGSEGGVQQHVMSITEFIQSDRTWTSPCSGGTYPLNWTVKFQDGTEVLVSTIRDDQEFCSPENLFQPTYEGYITFRGTDGKGNQISGFGLVEVCLQNIDG
ncbi:hypothetical protein BDV19DRAFT_397908 [Aspergillus venezuelensis]